MLAGPPSVSYKVRKFVKRNRGPVLAAALVLAALVAGIVGTTVGLIRAERARAAEAKQRGIPYRLAKLPMSSVFRAITISETRGFMKALIDTESDRILGFTMFGAGAGEVMTTVQMTMLAGSSYTALRDAIITHPTMPEGLIQLLAGMIER